MTYVVDIKDKHHISIQGEEKAIEQPWDLGNFQVPRPKGPIFIVKHKSDTHTFPLDFKTYQPCLLFLLF